MICPNCGSIQIHDSSNTPDMPSLFQYWCVECSEGFNDGDYEKLGETPPQNTEEKIHLYTDGACQNNPGPAGAGVLMIYKNHEKRISKFLGPATNNIAELTAIKIAFEAVTDNSKQIVVYTDSQYAIGVLSNPTWNPKKNVELIKEIKKLMTQFKKIDFQWVKGHSSNTENEITDRLAVKAYIDKKDSIERGTRK